MSEGWFNEEHPPWGECVDAGKGVWSMWESRDSKLKLMLWHWCDRNVSIAIDKRDGVETGTGLGQRDPCWYEKQWVLVGTEGHEVSGGGNAATLHPSVLWSYCCNKHGYLEKGKWRDC